MMRTVTLASPRVVPRWRDATAWLWLGVLAHAVVATVCALSPAVHLGDFHRYWELATTPGRVYVDYPAEYPPGAVLLFHALAAFAGRQDVFNALLLFANLVADVVIVAVLAGSWGIPAAAAYTWIGLPILSLLYFRFDLWTVAAVTGAVALWRQADRQRGATTERGTAAERGAVAMLCAGAAVKLWPLPFAALFMTGPRGWRSPAIRWCVAGGVIVTGLWFAWSGVDGFREVLTFRGATGWDIESSIGSVWRIVEPASMRLESGAVRVGHNLPGVSIALFVMSMPVATWAIWRGAVTGHLGSGWVAGIGAMLATSALLSPQFLGWLLPGAAMAWAEGDRRTTRGVAALVAWTVCYRILHTREVPELVLLRNLALIAFVVATSRRLAAEPSAAEPTDDGLVFRFQPEPPPGGDVAHKV